MPQKINIEGKVFGRWTVLSEDDQIGISNKKVFCICQCGVKKYVFKNTLLSGASKSCGCFASERAIETHTVHGHTKGGKVTTEFRIWWTMIERCSNPQRDSYKDYGAKGVIVCDRWLGDLGFSNFLLDMGLRPSKEYTLDRFPDTRGNYELSNCRWATNEQQARNRTNNVWLTNDGVTMVRKDWATKMGIDDETISYHMKKGKSFPEVVKYFNKKKSAA